jgi:hypothetical protein
MDWLWTWGGTSFGYRDGDNLWTHDGRHVGKFHGDEIYGQDGRYLGEIRKGNRLITRSSKKSRKRSGFTPYANRVGYVDRVGFVGLVMIVGYEDFPSPREL